MKRIVVETPGGPEQMTLVEVPKPAPGPKEAVVAMAFSGVNFIDVYFRTGLYKSDIPIVLGSEAAGTVESVGSEVTEVAPGDRVAYAMVRGSYAEYALVPAAQLVKIPDDVDFAHGSRGHAAGHDGALPDALDLSAEAGNTCLVHAAAGGTGGLIVQMARHLGARVFGTVSTEEKAGRCASARRRRDHHLHDAGLRGRGEAAHRRPRRRRRLRFGRQDDLRQEPDRAAPARHDGALRPVERLGAALRSGRAQRARARSS